MKFPGLLRATLTLMGMLSFAVGSHAAENEASAENRFHLFTSKCEPEAATEGAETTPQSPPLNVDDPATPGCNRWEINVVLDGDFTRSDRSLELPLLDINYGIGDNIQLKYEVPNVNFQSDGVATQAVGESKAGVKYMFYEDEASKLALAVYPQVTFVDASSDAVKKGLASTGSITTLPFLVSKKIGELNGGEVNLSANIGYNISGKSEVKDYVSGAIGIGMPLYRRTSIASELSTEQAVAALPEEARSQLVRAAVGVVGPITKEFLLFGSVGRSLVSSDERDHTYVLAGFRLLAGGIVK